MRRATFVAAAALLLAGCSGSGGGIDDFCDAGAGLDGVNARLDEASADLSTLLSGIDPTDDTSDMSAVQAKGEEVLAVVDEYEDLVNRADAGANDADVTAAIEVMKTSLIEPLRGLGEAVAHSETAAELAEAIVALTDDFANIDSAETEAALDTLDAFDAANCPL